MPDPSAKTYLGRPSSDASRRLIRIPAALLVDPSNGTVRMLALRGGFVVIPDTITVETTIEHRFHQLSEEWHRETGFLSSITKKCTHPAYLKIIGLSERVVPILLRELERQPDHWFFALHILTDQDPVEEGDAGNMQRMSDAWLRWGREHGYI